MIANITKGRKAVGALIYDFGPGRRDEHINPRIVAGNTTGTPMQVARAIDHTARQRPEIKAPIWRASLSLPDEDGILPDGQWGQIAEDFIRDMGFDGAPWVAVRHGDDHIHLTVSRVDWSGQLISDRWDFRRARESADRLEEQHGLVRARDRFRAEGPQVRNNELEAARRRGRELDSALPPEREELRRIVREVRDASRGLGRAAFESGLEDAGVSSRANVASTGRMSGYSFALAGWTDSAGAQVWVSASKVAKDLRWMELHKVLGDGPAKTPRIPDPRIEFAVAATTTAADDVAATEQAAETESRLQDPPHDVDLAAAAERGAEILRQGQAERAIVPVPEQAVEQVARSTDPAAGLLAQWRAIRAGEEAPADPVPTAPARIPGWDQRRYGELNPGRLLQEVRRLEKKVTDQTTLKKYAERELRSGDAIATGQTTGPNVQSLHQKLDRLEAVEPHITAATKQMKIATAAETVTDEARTEWRDADQLKGKGRWELWRMGTSRAGEEERAKKAAAVVHANSATAAKAREAASRDFVAARTKSGSLNPGEELAHLRENWPDLVAGAQSADQSYGRDQREMAQASIERAEKNIAQAEKSLAALRQEQEYRRAMPRAQRDAENRIRGAAVREAEVKKAAKKPGTSRRYTGAQYEQPAHLRRPPPPTRGPSSSR